METEYDLKCDGLQGRRKFNNAPFYVDGETVNLSKEGTFKAQHIMVFQEIQFAVLAINLDIIHVSYGID